MKNGIPQNTGILRFVRGISNKNGPGQRPPIPHPKPNKNDPMINFQSMLPLVSDSPFPKSKKGFFLK